MKPQDPNHYLKVQRNATFFSERSVFKSILRSEESGILFLDIDARIAGAIDFVTGHATMYGAFTFDTRNVRDSLNSCAVDTIWLICAQWDDAASACRHRVRSFTP
jgi:hypothetical protein